MQPKFVSSDAVKLGIAALKPVLEDTTMDTGDMRIAKLAREMTFTTSLVPLK